MSQVCSVALLGVLGVTLSPSSLRADAVNLRWPAERIELVLGGDRNGLQGIQRAAIEGIVVSAGPVAGRVLVETDTGGRYTRCRFVSLRREGGEQTVVTRLDRKDGTADRLEWHFRPATLQVASHRYRGFEYSWRFHSETARVIRLVDLTDWTLSGRPDELYLIPPRQVPGSDPVVVRPGLEFLRTPCFWFQGDIRGRGCLLLSHRFDDTVPWVKTGMSRAAGSTELRFEDEFLGSRSHDAHTPWRRVLVCPEAQGRGLELEDEYARCLDTVEGEVRRHFGIREPAVRRLCIRASEGVRPGNSTPSYAAVVSLLDDIAAAGFERVWPGCIWNNAGSHRQPPRPDLAILDMTFSPFGGGEAGLRRLCQEAKGRGLGIYTWSPSGQLVTDSPYWTSHPDWFPKRENGTRYAYGGSALTWTDLNSGYYRMTMEGFERARALGVSGMWFDSFGSVASVIDYTDPEHLESNLPPAFRRMKQLQDLGYEMLYIEGSGPAGIDGYPRAYLDEGGYEFYKSGHFVYHIRPDKYDVYFRHLANLATPILAWKFTLRTYRGTSVSEHPALVKRLTYDNFAFRKVRGQMVHRRLLAAPADPWRCLGVEWHDSSGIPRVVWAYERQSYSLPPGTRAVEVLSGNPAPDRGGEARLEAERVYRLVAADQ